MGTLGARAKVAVVGSGAWGTTLAIVAARAGNDVVLYVGAPEEAARFDRQRCNDRFLPDSRLPVSVRITSDLEAACARAAMILLVPPSQTMRANAAAVAPFISDAIIVSAAKGLERASLGRMTEVLRQQLPETAHGRLCALSGPNLAVEVAALKPAATVVAADDVAIAERVRDLLMTNEFRVYTNDDVVGVEMAGALKNIIAIGAGIADGLQAGENAKAAFLTRGMAEIARLGVASGARPLTFAGLAGLGDVVATCASPLSRNRYVGVELAKGRRLPDIQGGMVHVAEGIFTTDAAHHLGQRLGVEMPITDQLYAVLFADKSPLAAVTELMQRDAKHELEGLRAIADRYGVESVSASAPTDTS